MADSQQKEVVGQQLLRLLKEFYEVVLLGLKVPRRPGANTQSPEGITLDRFRRTVWPYRVKAVGIVKNLTGLGFIANARQLEAALDSFYASIDPQVSVLRPGPDRALYLDRRIAELGLVLGEVATLVTRSIRGPQGKRESCTVPKANAAAMKLARKDPNFVAGGARDWAADIENATGKKCTTKIVLQTPFWIATMEETGRGRTRGKTPKAVALTGKLESVIGKGDKHQVLQDLIAERTAGERKAAIEAVQQSGMDPDAQTAALERLTRGEMSPEKVKEMASLFPPKSDRPVKRFGRV